MTNVVFSYQLSSYIIIIVRYHIIAISLLRLLYDLRDNTDEQLVVVVVRNVDVRSCFELRLNRS
jgi:hypothetical protein